MIGVHFMHEFGNTERPKHYFDRICSEYYDQLSCGKISEKTKYKAKQNNTCHKTKPRFSQHCLQFSFLVLAT